MGLADAGPHARRARPLRCPRCRELGGLRGSRMQPAPAAPGAGRARFRGGHRRPGFLGAAA
eukprot:14359000-Alexandrium_andersonii.AAC.1